MALALDPRYVIDIQPRRQPAVTAATYRRRRLVVGLLIAVVAIVLYSAATLAAGRGGAPASASTVSPVPAAPTTYVVHAGDSLWGIAERFAEGRSVGEYVEALVLLNGGPSIQVGEVITLP